MQHALILQLAVSGYVQADAVVYDQSSADEIDFTTGEPLNESRFLIRRARLRGDLVHDCLRAGLELDGNTVRGPAARLIAAEVGWEVAPALFTIGLFKIPFGLEVQEKTPARLFLEPSTAVRAFFPGDYDLGGKVEARWRFLRGQLAVLNGAPVGDRQFGGQDPNASKDVVGRLGIVVAPAGVTFAAGVSALFGEGLHPGQAETKDTLVWRDNNENGRVELTELSAIPGTPATPSESFERFALGGDLRVGAGLGPLLVDLYTELIWAENLDRGVEPADPRAAGRDLRELGFAVAVAVTGPRGLRLAARYDRYDPDADAADQQGAELVPLDRTYATSSLVLGWSAGRYGRVFIEYDHKRNALGRDEAGLPTTLEDDALTIRVQGEL
jgi:hypothetical protein